MKAIISGLAMMIFLGWMVSGSGEDVSRVVRKPPETVYHEMAGLFPRTSKTVEGAARDGRHRKLEIRVRRALDSEIDFSMALDGAQVLAMNLAFAPRDGGRATHVTGEMSLDQELVRFAAAQSGGSPQHVPDFAVDYAMKEMVETMAAAIEAGEPLRRDMLFPFLNVAG